jgi:hypothetical protein
MNDHIQKKIDQLEAQRDQTLLQLGSINGALAVYREWLNAPPAGTPDTTSAAPAAQ